MSQDRSASNPITALTAMVRDDLDSVNALIVDHMQSDVPLIPELAGYLVASGGKRIRPLLTLATARLCGYQGRRQIGLAASVEFIHTATLLHDDVVDESDMRRGKQTANAIWDNKSSVLVGDFLFSRAFQLMVADGSLRSLKILADASAIIAEGEVLQLMTANNVDCTVEDYMQVISAKTAALFAAATQIGGIVAEVDKSDELALTQFGTNIGIAFQVVDDLLDYAAQTEGMGKDPGDDFREGKMTIPVIAAIEKADADERAFWQRTMGELDQHDGDLERALDLIAKHGGMERTRALAKRYVDSAKASLDRFGEDEMKTALLALCDFVLARGY